MKILKFIPRAKNKGYQKLQMMKLYLNTGAKKNINSFFVVAFISICSFSVAKADTGKIIPDAFVWSLAIAFLLVLVFAYLLISALVKFFYKKNDKNESKKLFLILLITILPPMIWLYAEANYHLLYEVEAKYDYRIKEIFNKLIAIIVAMLGMGAGFIIKKLVK
jgi:hypothetical protein